MTVHSGVAGTKRLKAMPAKQERIVSERSQRISFKRYAAIVRIEARCPARCPIKTSCSIRQPSRSTYCSCQTIPPGHKDERHVAILDRKSQLVSWERGLSRPHQRAKDALLSLT